MSIVDVNRILTESPKKRLIIGFDKLKENFTESAALEYAEIYKHQSLSFILENSRLIFSEPYHGCNFYKEVMCGENELCAFTQYATECGKVDGFIEENAGHMEPEQLFIYQELSTTMHSKLNSLRNTVTMATYAESKRGESSFELELSDVLYEAVKERRDGMHIDETENKIQSLIESVSDPTTFFVYAPYVNKVVGGSSIIEPNLDKFYKEAFTEDDALEESVFKPFIENVFTVSKLSEDTAYMEAVHSIKNVSARYTFEGLAQESAKSHIDELITERVSTIETFYSTPKAAVNSIFMDDLDAELYREENDAYREKHFGLQKVAYESLMDFILFEYQNSDDISDIISGYNFFKEGTTIEAAFEELSIAYEHAKSMLGIVEEAANKDDDDEDVSDDDISALEREVHGDDEDKKEDNSSKKANAPKAKNLANKIQNKAMDAEVKQSAKMATMKQKGQEVKNAVKAVVTLPINVLNDIKSQTKKLDEVDADRRKQYMIEPGFRKKAFRNLKLAITYGTAAQVKLSLVPVVALTRHFSKERDRRIRNELMKEIDTNIKVCDEKISDANAAGDNKEKYRLMRIKSDLEAELVRVKTNSRYI